MAWGALGCAPVLWCVWTTASAAAPLPMVVVNGAAIVAALVGIALPAGREVGARGARALVPGGSALVLAGVVLLFFASGAAVSAITLAAPPARHNEEIAAPRDSEVAAADSLGPADAAPPAPTSPQVATGSTPHVRVEANDEADPAPGAARVEATEAEPVPGAEALRLDRLFWAEAERHPDGDAHATVARREHIEVQALMAAIIEVSAYRVRLEADARETFARRPAMLVLPDGVHGSALGNTTLAVRLFVPGCPAGRRADPEQLALAQDMLVRLRSIIADGIDSYEAELYSDGAPCGRRELSFSATWTRDENRVSIRDRP